MKEEKILGAPADSFFKGSFYHTDLTEERYEEEGTAIRQLFTWVVFFVISGGVWTGVACLIKFIAKRL